MISRYFTHPLRKYRPLKGDKQAHRVYSMEKEIIGWSVDTHVKPEKLAELAAHACRKWKVRQVEIRVRSAGDNKPFGWCSYDSITLNKDWHGDNYATLLHELAHWIDGEKNGDKHESHGPVFVSIYRQLLHDYRMLPKDCFDVLARRYKVKRGRHD